MGKELFVKMRGKNMGRNRRANQEIIDQINNEYDKGLSIKEIAVVVKLSESCVREKLKNGETYKERILFESQLEQDYQKSEKIVDKRRKRIEVVDGKKMVDVTDFMFSC